MALAHERQNDLLAAESGYRQALTLRPDYGEAWHNLGNVLRKEGRPVEAAEAHANAARLLPDVPVVHGALAAALLDIGRFDEAIESYRRRAEVAADPAPFESTVLFWRLHDPWVSEEEHFAAHVEWARRHRRTLLPPAHDLWEAAAAPGDGTMVAEGVYSVTLRPASCEEAGATPAPNGRPLRVGYVSADFREHTIARFFEPLLANHDPAAVTTVCYSDVEQPDAVTQRLRSLAAEWHDTMYLSDHDLADLVREDRIDVLVDLTGHAPGGRLRLFTLRPAPVQVTYLCYPHSTGVSEIDYRITDAASDPPGMTERYHVEELVTMDRCAWCYRPDDGQPEPDEPPALRNGFVTFGSFNRMAKITPTVALLWARVLDAVPRSRLMVLAAGGEANTPVRRMLEVSGIPSDRLRLVPAGPRPSYLDLCRQADIGLDPFPYNGMTTTCDLLWLGVPTVTLAGASHRARVGASLLTTVGLPELIATDQQGYLRAASNLAADADRLRQTRLTLRDRMAASPLCDGAGLARRMEAAYRST